MVVGRLGRPHGVAGEVRVEVLTDFPEQRFYPGARVLIGRSVRGPARETELVSVRPYQHDLLARLSSAATREEVGALTGSLLLVAAEESAPLPEDAYYEHQLLGLEVVTEAGALVGRVSQLIETGTADVLVIEGPGAEQLIPLTKEVIHEIDLAAGRIVITPLPGLLDLPDRA